MECVHLETKAPPELLDHVLDDGFSRQIGLLA
jgi:hypothetical protein